MSDTKRPLPELLCPAGSPEALDAAIEGGADAVYLGGVSFNARMNATNFGGDALRSAVLRAHSYGVKVYLTLNTLVTQRELPQYVAAAGEAYAAGVDALIIADLGGAAAVRRAYPTLELHASTQMSGHNAEMGQVLSRLGYSRMVLARETSLADIREAVRNAGMEIELFIHGALCVSHSGQCLFSSMVGGRSGNRGECAQPCRLPFACADCKKRAGEQYPLSLKDLSLAAHVPELIESGVASLKIEGRMKSPEYVRDTARIWRRLLDERRAATPSEMRALSDIFSRGGFTDGYFTGRIDRSMLGIRSEEDKSRTRAVEPFTGITRRLPLTVHAILRQGEACSLTLSDGQKSVTVMGDIPMPAQNAPLTREGVGEKLSKLGGTPYTVGSFSLDLDEGLMLPVSRLNDLRRRAVVALQEGALREPVDAPNYTPVHPVGKRETLRSARFYTPMQITKQARQWFDCIYLPLFCYDPKADGVVLPPVIFDSERTAVAAQLQKATEMGAKYALVGNLGHLSLVRDVGLIPIGDYRLNITNSESIAQAEQLGLSSCILSPELTLPQIRDIGGGSEVIVYGRLPLMTLEKCVIREVADCKTCEKNAASLRDRRGVEFPVLREWEHRNVIYNSLPTNMSDREEELKRSGITARHFIFSTERAAEVDAVIEAYRAHSALPGATRRL